MKNDVDKWDEIKTYPHENVDKSLCFSFFVEKGYLIAPDRLIIKGLCLGVQMMDLPRNKPSGERVACLDQPSF
ncbi:hypothetical protein DUE52_19580 [Larkinella punicea]|uniref:Uncharacterized protein n=1 Tax=Larkinella punicea TaxID=2315727 RepID=A0A368JMP0_9BACT|nr:hypothetical protein DUE52_19580 [Larkinella punicea]